jgi:hydroxyacylglutathione hydrolase
MKIGMHVEVFRTSFTFLKNQCYVVYKSGQGVLVDPAWEFDVIDLFLTENHINLLAVLVTHAHPDHTNLAGRFAEKYRCPVYMSSVEIDYSGFHCANLTAVAELEEIYLGSFSAKPLLTPGHSPGGLCYLIEDHLFTGDTVFIEGVGSCGSDEVAAGALFDSVQKIKAYAEETTCFWPGHSFGMPPGKKLNFLMEHNIYFQLNNRDYFIKFRTRKNRPDPFRFRCGGF